jgi:phosphatidylinositol alpha-1,6-mannosyltransferase
MGQVARFVKKTLGIPYVVVLHGMDVASAISAGGRKRAAAGRALKDADLIVANSAYTALWLATYGIDPGKAVIVPPPPSLPLEDAADPANRIATRRDLGIDDGTFVLLSVSRLVRRKGIDTAIRAVAELRASGRKVRYLVIGGGPDRVRLDALVDELGVGDAVSFLGEVDARTLAATYAAADAFIMVPRAEGPDVEGFGIVYLEAGLMGLPAIGSRTGGVPEAVKHEATGLLIEPDDVKAASEAVMRLMDDVELARRLGAEGRARVLREYGDDRQAKRFMAAVKTLRA